MEVIMSLHPTRNTLPNEIREKSVQLLGQSLVAAIDLQRQAKQAHWNVQGPNFIALHLLFDDVHTAAVEWADLSAERLVALGGTADGRVRHVADNTKLEPYPLELKEGMDHVRHVAGALAKFGQQVRDAIIASADFGDATTSDVFTEISRGVDAYLWKVEAHHYAA
ncbi:DNA starvation/stationary phase protection protein Dps [Paraburkholderia strydomiana]|uniref:DNA starvation/stationary phase protection protein Dps n=1 Tax=Paraburkholderia strydomiana TaxID=1245417 RepID=UPI00285D6A77|nr:DNA starvation/stationary phase protection protein Dps [Paraburkholderia strydomiana]MDR7010059.1 starvation-inducible DNA-binding protein [Paraburkholderia strydomiana]